MKIITQGSEAGRHAQSARPMGALGATQALCQVLLTEHISSHTSVRIGFLSSFYR